MGWGGWVVWVMDVGDIRSMMSESVKTFSSYNGTVLIHTSSDETYALTNTTLSPAIQ